MWRRLCCCSPSRTEPRGKSQGICLLIDYEKLSKTHIKGQSPPGVRQTLVLAEGVRSAAMRSKDSLCCPHTYWAPTQIDNRRSIYVLFCLVACQGAKTGHMQQCSKQLSNYAACSMQCVAIWCCPSANSVHITDDSHKSLPPILSDIAHVAPPALPQLKPILC